MTESKAGQLRVSFINFLNSVPLGWSFLHGDLQNAFELIFDVPSECARRLQDGEADVGLIPVIEYQNNPELTILPDISISSKREVRTVLFASKLPLPQVRRVAVDTSSRTSAALLKIVMKEFLGLDSIVYEPHRPDPERMLQGYDAALIIGNPAFRVARQRFFVFDLAQEWSRWTGLPFVFAFWAVRRCVDLGRRIELFYRSRDEGLRRLPEIAQLYSEKLDLPPEDIRRYLSRHLDYSLDEENLKGLRAFYEMAAHHNLIGKARPLEFYPSPEGLAEASKKCASRRG